MSISAAGDGLDRQMSVSASSAFFKIENIPNLEMSISAAGGGLCRGLGVRQMSTVTHPVDEACSDAM